MHHACALGFSQKRDDFSQAVCVAGIRGANLGAIEGKEDSMAYWLIKSEPGAWSWDDQVRDGTTHWNGVRNYQASNNLKAMKIGDLCFFYHSVNEKRIVGIVEVVKEYYPDDSDPSGRFGMVDVKMVEPIANPVTLAQIKATEALADMPLIRQSRLSVMPVTKAQWELILKMGSKKA